jgi:hypothetical protein
MSRDPGQSIRIVGDALPGQREPAGRAMTTARSTGLKLCDAVYLTKGLNDGRVLASRDRQLLEAASAAGVDVYDARG